MRTRVFELVAAVLLVGCLTPAIGCQSDADKAEGATDRLQAQVKLLQAEIISQKKRAAAAAKEIDQLKRQNHELKQQIDSIKAEIAKLRLLLAKTDTQPASRPGDGGTYYLIPVKGMIGGDFTAAHMEAHLKQAAQARPAAVILEIDTPGGSFADSKKIVDLIVGSKGLRFVAVVRRGFAAGAAITLACKEIYVAERAVISGGMVLLGDGNPPPKAGAEKLQSVWRATCRKAAQCGGHPALIAEAMTDPDFALTMRKEGGRVVLERNGKGKVLKAKDTILTLMAAEALACGLATGRAADHNDLARQLGLQRTKKPEPTPQDKPADR